MPIYIPHTLSALAKIATDETGRYNQNCVHVQDTGEGTYRIEATNGRILAIARGHSAACHFPEFQLEKETKNACLLAKDWLEGLKLGRAGKKSEPVGFVAAEGQGLFASRGQKHQVQLQEGRFAPCDSIVPRKGAMLKVKFDAKLLLELLQVAVAIGADKLTLIYYGEGKALGLAGASEDGVFFDGLLMPLADK